MKTLKRTQAADILDRIRVMLAQERSADTIEYELEKQYGIRRLEKCDGEAHKNAHIDNCSECLPRWGFVGSKIKIT